MRGILLFILLISCPIAQAGVKKNLTAIISDRNMSPAEYKTLETFATGLGKDINKNWFPADYPNNNLRTVVKIQFIPDGVHHYEFMERSNNPSFDDSCYMAVNRSLNGLGYPHVTTIEYLFEYNNKKTQIPREVGRWPAQFGIGYLSKKFGINHFVNIPIY